MNEKNNRRINLSPPQQITLVFLFLIFLGTFLLILPISSAGEASVSWLDAFFTATSAVCVNGLTVVDISSSFSTFGQIVIMILIQIGGLGFMTFGVVVAILFGKRISLKERLVIQQSTQSQTGQGLIKLSLSIFFIAFAFEIIATLILTIRWMKDLSFGQALYYAIFHSVSAFNNAGFSLWPNSLAVYYNDPIVYLTVMALFISGGLGFIVIVEIFKKRKWRKFSLHTKIVLLSTPILLFSGFVLILLLESWNKATFGALTWQERIGAALFHSATARSAGFHTIDISNMLSTSQLILIILMFIGAASGSTGGGIKVNTFVVLMLATINTFRGGGPIHAFHRRIGTDTVMRALAVAISSIACILFVALLLSITEGLLEDHFLEVLFEATSAFSTTGLSMGLTSELSPLGKVIVAITMFIGRLGPLTLAYALAKKKKTTKVHYPEDHILIG